VLRLTFTLDELTVERLRRTAERLGKAQSQVVREAIQDYAARSDRLSDEERRRLLSVMDDIIASPPTRSQAEVEAELREIRVTRRRGWRPRPPSGRR
jgi:metal-responsive CopG/Arc/MetJ family transcriptional regulator